MVRRVATCARPGQAAQCIGWRRLALVIWGGYESKMAKLVKVSHAEIERIEERSGPAADLGGYAAFLRALEPGDWGVVTLEEGENADEVKRQLTATAAREGKTIEYHPSEDNAVVFEVR
jgi:hypothetical protein